MTKSECTRQTHQPASQLFSQPTKSCFNWFCIILQPNWRETDKKKSVFILTFWASMRLCSSKTCCKQHKMHKQIWFSFGTAHSVMFAHSHLKSACFAHMVTWKVSQKYNKNMNIHWAMHAYFLFVLKFKFNWFQCCYHTMVSGLYEEKNVYKKNASFWNLLHLNSSTWMQFHEVEQKCWFMPDWWNSCGKFYAFPSIGIHQSRICMYLFIFSSKQTNISIELLNIRIRCGFSTSISLF